MNVIFRFKIYDNIVLSEKKELYQLSHFNAKYTHPFKKLVYNEERKAYKVKETFLENNITNFEIQLWKTN